MRVYQNSLGRSIAGNPHNDTDAYFITAVCNVASVHATLGGYQVITQQGQAWECHAIVKYLCEINQLYPLSPREAYASRNGTRIDNDNDNDNYNDNENMFITIDLHI